MLYFEQINLKANIEKRTHAIFGEDFIRFLLGKKRKLERLIFKNRKVRKIEKIFEIGRVYVKVYQSNTII